MSILSLFDYNNYRENIKDLDPYKINIKVNYSMLPDAVNHYINKRIGQEHNPNCFAFDDI